MQTLNDMTLAAAVKAQNGVYNTGQRLRSQEGATTVEYVMILGIMALIVAAIFLSNGGVRDKLWNDSDSLGRQVIDTITSI
jgi:Flp pilus assembly pilin Flp